MIKAAFCDDDDTVLKELQSLLEEYRRERDYRIDAKVYHSPLDLLNEMEKGTRFDILFLDNAGGRWNPNGIRDSEV